MNFKKFVQTVKPSYSFDWFHEVLVEEIQTAIETSGNLLCAAPPGSGKTELIGILFPSWCVAEDPNTHIISLSNSDSLSRMAASNILRHIQSPAFHEMRPVVLDKATEQTFSVKGNDGRPTLHSAGIFGQLSGHRANKIVYDDLTKDLSAAYSETIRERTWGNFNAAAETRLLPNGQIFGIQTRWHLDDVTGKLLKRARENAAARQFRYLCLAAVNRGSDSYIEDTRTGEKTYFPPYSSLATVKGQPYSFGSKAIAGKRADLGPTIYSALYQQQPVSGEDQMFPPENWGQLATCDPSEYSLIVTTWDTAARDKANNDPSCNVVVGRRHRGDFVVLDCTEFRLKFDKLLPVVLERYRCVTEQFRTTPVYLCVEDKSSGQQLIDIIRAQFPGLPLLAAKAVHSKIVRAEGVTPFTTAKSVSLLQGEWNGQFITDMANFPASDRDHCVDAFGHSMKVFTGTGSDFQTPAMLPVFNQQFSREAHLAALTQSVLDGDY